MDYREKIEATRLANTSSAEAIAWLEKKALKEKPRWTGHGNARHVMEYLLFRRRDVSVNLALARFGTYGPVLRKLYQEGNKVTQLSVLTNAFVGPKEFLGPDAALIEEDINGLIRDFPKTMDHLKAYFENPNIPRRFLENLLNKEELFETIDDTTFCNLVSYLAENEIITKPRDDTYLDGFSEYSYNQLFFALMALVGTVPTEQYWAGILTPIVQKVYLPFLPSEINFDMINRWRIEKPEEKDDEGSGTPKKRRFDPQLSNSFWLRQALAIRFLKDGDSASADAVTPDHEDKPVRLAYYSACKPEAIFDYFVREKDFEYPNFEYLKEHDEYLNDGQRKIVEICKQRFDQDKNEFIEELIGNDNFWRRKQERELLETLAWDLADDPRSSMDLPNILRGLEARLKKEKPEYFKDDEFVDTTEEASVDDLLRTVIERMDKIDEKLEGTQTSQQRLDDLNQGILEQLYESSAEYGLLSQRLQKIEEKIRRPSWSITLLLVVAAAVFGAWLSGQYK